MIKSLSLFLSGVVFTVGMYLVLHTSFPIQFETMKSVYNHEPSDKLSDLGKSFQTKWQSEVKELIKDKKIFNSWKKIRSVNLIFKSKLYNDWKNHLKAPVPINEAGIYDLDVLLLSWEEGKNLAAVIQYDLMEAESRNILWERGHTIYLKGSEAGVESLNSDE